MFIKQDLVPISNRITLKFFDVSVSDLPAILVILNESFFNILHWKLFYFFYFNYFGTNVLCTIEIGSGIRG